MCDVECGELFGMNFIILFFVLSKFIIKLLAANHLIVWERTEFDTGKISKISVQNCDNIISKWYYFWYTIYSQGKSFI
jgi:hypothetical protein